MWGKGTLCLWRLRGDRTSSFTSRATARNAHVGTLFNTMSPRQNGRHFPNDIFKCIFLNENVYISFKISLTFVPKGPVNNIPALVQIMACRRPGDKSLTEPMMVSLLTHICVTRPCCVIAVGFELFYLWGQQMWFHTYQNYKTSTNFFSVEGIFLMISIETNWFKSFLIHWHLGDLAVILKV